MSKDQRPDEEEREEPSGSLTGTVVRGASMAGGAYGLAQALNLGVYVVLSRLLTPTEFGEYAAATLLVGFGLMITESGMQAAVVQRRDRIDEAQSTAAAAIFVAGVLAGLLSAAAAPLIGEIFDSTRIRDLAWASSGLIFVNTMAAIPGAILQRRFSFLRLVVVGPLEVVVFGIVAITLAANGMGPWALVIGNYAGLASNTIVTWAFARFRPRLSQMSIGMWRELIAYGRYVFSATLVWRLGETATDALIIGRMLGTAALGQFRYAFRIATLPYQLILAGASYAIFPVLARMQDDPERLKAAFLRSLRWLAALGVPGGLILIPLGPAAAELIFGEVWRPAGYAAAAMAGYAVGNSVVAAVVEMLKASGRPEPMVPMHAISTIVTIFAMLILAQVSLTAAALGISIGALAGGAYGLYAAAEVTGISVRSMWGALWPPLTAGAVMAVAVLPIDRFVLEPSSHGTALGLALLTAEALLCAAIFVAVLAPLAPQTVRDIATTLGSRVPGLRDLLPAGAEAR